MDGNFMDETIIQQTIEHGGQMELDLSDETHFRFFTELYGGEAQIQNQAPALHSLLQRQKAAPPAPHNADDASPMGTVDFASIDEYRIIQKKNARGESFYELSAAPCIDYVTPAPFVYCRSQVIEWYEVNGEKRINILQDTELPTSRLDEGLRYEARLLYQTMDSNLSRKALQLRTIFTRPAQNRDGELTLRPIVAATEITVFPLYCQWDGVAKNIALGDRLLDSEDRETTVSNVSFGPEETLLHTEMAGGHSAAPPPAGEMRTVMTELQKLIANHDHCPRFQSSDRPESFALHYFTVKVMAEMAGFSPAQAQYIAEFCQFLSDNAITGGLRMAAIPQWCLENKLFRLSEEPLPYEVLFFPTAMETWYAEEELATPKPWFPDEKNEKERSGEYDVARDILGPFHFFRSNAINKPPRVTFRPESLRDMLNDLAKRVAMYEDNPQDIPSPLLVEMGILIHILIDTKTHEHFIAEKSWVNVCHVSSLIGWEPIHRPFKDYRIGLDGENYPYGLQQVGWSPNDTFGKPSYSYPLGDFSIHKQVKWSSFNSHNAPLYAQAVREVYVFLLACRNLPEPTEWTSTVFFKQLEELFKYKSTDFQSLCPLWEKFFCKTEFKYDSKSVFGRLVTPVRGGKGPEGEYPEFFAYTRLLHTIRQAYLAGTAEGKHIVNS